MQIAKLLRMAIALHFAALSNASSLLDDVSLLRAQDDDANRLEQLSTAADDDATFVQSILKAIRCGSLVCSFLVDIERRQPDE